MKISDMRRRRDIRFQRKFVEFIKASFEYLNKMLKFRLFLGTTCHVEIAEMKEYVHKVIQKL